MGIVFKNNAKTTLGSSLTNSATSATVTDGSVFPSLAAGEFFFCTFDDGTNNEIVKVTARSSNTLTIVRAQESTTARAFSSGDAAELRLTAGVLETIQENIAAKSANQTVFNATTSGGATSYDIGIDPGVEANAMVFLDGVMQHHDTFSFSSNTLTFDAAPVNGTKLEVIVDNLINLQSSNLTVDSFTAADVSGSPQTDFTLSDTPAAETNLIVFVDGVFQDQDAYTISTNTLTITTGVIAGRGVTVYIINPVNIGTPSDGTVTSAKLSGNITMPGTLTVGSNDVAFDSPTFVVDNSNSRVGLGTASPSVPVDIVGDVKMSANLTVDTSTLIVDSSNNRVGIGTTSPSKKFVVSEGGAHGFEISPYDGSQNATRLINYNRNTSAYFPLEIEASQIAFEIGGTEKMRLDSSGRVGIGTTAPDEKLHISGGGIKVDGEATIASGSGTGVFLDYASDVGRITALDQGTAWRSLRLNAADIQFYIAGGERMRINSSGQVGIGTTSPDSGIILDVRGNVRIGDGSAAEQDIAFLSANGSWQVGSNDSGNGTNNNQFYIYDTTASAYLLTVQRGGNVGIGQTSPNANLHIGAANAVGDATNPALQIGPASGNTYRLGLYTSSEGGVIENKNGDDGLQFRVKTVGEAMRISGSTGIITKPYQPAFHAYGATSGTSNADVIFANTYVNTGNHYSTTNGRFTAPVAGVYVFFWSAIGNNTNDVYRYFLHKNGSVNIANSGNDIHLRMDTLATGSEYATNGSRVQMLALAQNDYVQIFFKADSNNSTYTGSQDDYMNFGGFLIG